MHVNYSNKLVHHYWVVYSQPYLKVSKLEEKYSAKLAVGYLH